MNAKKALEAMWPTSIPASSYDRAIALIQALSAPQDRVHVRKPEARHPGTLSKTAVINMMTGKRLRRFAHFDTLLSRGHIIGDGSGFRVMPDADLAVPHAARKPLKTHMSGEVVGQIASLLATGPATAKELIEATGLSEGSVYTALRQLGAIIVEERPRANGGIGRGVGVYGLPQNPRAAQP